MSETRVCKACGAEKPLSEFQKTGIRDGVQRYKSKCKICQGEVDRARYKRQRDFLGSLKLRCEKCGETRPEVLDFHHRNPAEKDFTIGRSPIRTEESLMVEIEKCVVLCSNCHREFHFRERREGITLIEYLNDEAG